LSIIDISRKKVVKLLALYLEITQNTFLLFLKREAQGEWNRKKKV